MPANWIVWLTKHPRPGTFKAGHFPHGFAYKKDATAAIREVEAAGGTAVVLRKGQSPPEDEQRPDPTRGTGSTTRSSGRSLWEEAMAPVPDAPDTDAAVPDAPDAPAPDWLLRCPVCESDHVTVDGSAGSAQCEEPECRHRWTEEDLLSEGGSAPAPVLPVPARGAGPALLATNLVRAREQDRAERNAVTAVPAGSEPFAPSVPMPKPSSTSQPAHVEVSALAGTGKTTTIMEGVRVVKGQAPAIKPSPQQAAVWGQLQLGRSDRIRLSAFNTSITDVLKAKVEEFGLDKVGVEARGIHSLGNGAVFKAFGRQQPGSYHVRNLTAEILGGRAKDLEKDEAMAVTLGAVDDLVSLCKLTLSEPTEANLDGIARHYDIEVEGDGKARVYQLVSDVLERCKNPTGAISFDDMVWLPHVHRLPIFKVDVQIVDEAQDMNRAQQTLMYRAGYRMVYVGDVNQAIYGFSGSDAESMGNMRAHLTATPRGLAVCPLTVTRRCGRAIVEEARRIVPEFEAHASNADGLVSHALYPVQRSGGNYWSGGKTIEVDWSKTYGPMVRPGDFVICRVNAPLVSQCFKFLRRGIKAVILGRKIGEGLLALVRKSKASTVVQLLGWLDEWRREERAREEARENPSESRLILIEDKVACLVAFTEGAVDVEDVMTKIGQVFTDDKTQPGIRLSSIHKAKGLEARRVFFLRPHDGPCPHPMAKSEWQRQQEVNCLYIAVTRAIEELVYVS